MTMLIVRFLYLEINKVKEENYVRKKRMPLYTMIGVFISYVIRRRLSLFLRTSHSFIPTYIYYTYSINSWPL